jgi:hypothetical protein
MSRAFTTLSLLALAGCANEQGFTPDGDVNGANGPQIQVDPEVIEFGSAGREETIAATFTVTNVGSGDLEVEGIEIGGTSTSFAILTPEEELHFILPGSAFREIEVAFTPLGANEQHGQAIVTSNDEDSPTVAVDLYGEGLVPDLQIDPNPYDFGDSYIGCERQGPFTLTNVGYDDLTIDSITLSGDRAFQLLTVPGLPLPLAPGESSAVDVSFLPDAEVDYSATFQVTSDAPGGTDRALANGTGIYAGDFQDVWEIPVDPPVDLMFVVDQSGSMDDDQRSLANNFNIFISRLSSFTTDWRIMVVNAYDGCNNSGILTYSTSGYEATFQTAVANGSQSEWENRGESGLFVSHQGVEQTDSGECNRGFMRADALLHIVIVTDEPDQTDTPGGWAADVAAIQTKKGSVANTRISAVAGDYPGGCGSAAPAIGLWEAVNATGGTFLSICSNWASMAEELADASIQLSEYELSHTPDPDTIVVRINSNVVGGWTFEEATNSVVFQRDIPVGGDTVRINYSALATCD